MSWFMASLLAYVSSRLSRISASAAQGWDVTSWDSIAMEAPQISCILAERAPGGRTDEHPGNLRLPRSRSPELVGRVAGCAGRGFIPPVAQRRQVSLHQGPHVSPSRHGGLLDSRGDPARDRKSTRLNSSHGY